MSWNRPTEAAIAAAREALGLAHKKTFKPYDPAAAFRAPTRKEYARCAYCNAMVRTDRMRGHLSHNCTCPELRVARAKAKKLHYLRKLGAAVTRLVVKPFRGDDEQFTMAAIRRRQQAALRGKGRCLLGRADKPHHATKGGGQRSMCGGYSGGAVDSNRRRH